MPRMLAGRLHGDIGIFLAAFFGLDGFAFISTFALSLAFFVFLILLLLVVSIAVALTASIRCLDADVVVRLLVLDFLLLYLTISIVADYHTSGLDYVPSVHASPLQHQHSQHSLHLSRAF
jgi:hypothetical protein